MDFDPDTERAQSPIYVVISVKTLNNSKKNIKI